MKVAGVTVLVVLGAVVCGDVTGISVEGQAYEGIVMALRDDLDPQHCDLYVDSVKDLIRRGSLLLHTSTGFRLSFGNVRIVVPAEWPCSGVSGAASTTWEQAHLRIGPTHPVFSNNPWTQQPRWCGDEGDYMYLPDPFVTSSAIRETSGAAALVHEWAKYRWGVFEEYGHEGDDVFPIVTWTRHNPPQLVSNHCTNQPLHGSIVPGVENVTCSDDPNTCVFQPDLNQSQNLTSSLMSVPDLSSVVKFCDDNMHDSNLPTKHNFMCNGESTWKVILRHLDMNFLQPGAHIPTTFNVQQVSSPLPYDKLVFLLDVSPVMAQLPGRWENLRDAVCQYIMVTATPGMMVGLIAFSRSPEVLSGLVSLETSEDREALALLVPEVASGSGTKNLAEAILKAKEVLGSEEGVVVLVTENLLSHTGEDLVRAAAGTPIWPILYPNQADVPKDIYADLADVNTHISLLTVYNSGHMDHQDMRSRRDIADHFLTVQRTMQGQESLQKIAEDSCIGLSCQMGLHVFADHYDKEDFVIEVFFDAWDCVECRVEVVDPEGIQLTNVTYTSNTSLAYTEAGLKSGHYIVMVNKEAEINGTVASVLLARERLTQGYSLRVADDGPYFENNGVGRRLYVEVLSGHSHIVFANVTAIVTPIDQPPVTLVLQDNGIGADTTGGDGVYSGFIQGVFKPGHLTVEVWADDNTGEARLVTSTAAAKDLHQICCGSQVTLPVDLPPTGPFVTSALWGGSAYGSSLTENLKPSRISDLTAVREDQMVTLYFTTPGDDLDRGTAKSYTIYEKSGYTVQTLVTEDTEPAGTLTTLAFNLTKCDVYSEITVRAMDQQSEYGDESNKVLVVWPCDEDRPSGGGPGGGMGPGAILLIIVVSLVALVLCAAVVHMLIDKQGCRARKKG